MTELLTAWAEIKQAFDQIGETDIRRALRQLGKMQPTETALGALHNEGLKKLWALAQRYEGEAKQCAIDSAHKAETEQESKELLNRARRLASLEEVVRDLFWVQAKDDIGEWGRTDGAIGLRENWMLVFTPERNHPLAALLGGIIRPE